MKKDAESKAIQTEIQLVAEALTRVGREVTIFLNGFVAICCEEENSRFKNSFLPSTQDEVMYLYRDAYVLFTTRKKKPEIPENNPQKESHCPWRERCKEVSHLKSFFEIYKKYYKVRIIFIFFSSHFPIH